MEGPSSLRLEGAKREILSRAALILMPQALLGSFGFCYQDLWKQGVKVICCSLGTWQQLVLLLRAAQASGGAHHGQPCPWPSKHWVILGWMAQSGTFGAATRRLLASLVHCLHQVRAGANVSGSFRTGKNKIQVWGHLAQSLWGV